MIRKAPQDSDVDAKLVALFDKVEGLQRKLDALSLSVNALSRHLPLEQDEATNEDKDEWTLNADQTIFMMQRHNQIEAAFGNEDMEFLHELASSEEFKSIFGEMNFDEAFDRYESMLEDGRANA